MSRFMARQDAKRKHWEVYDTEGGSYPMRVIGYGVVEGPFKTEKPCQDEADRLSKYCLENPDAHKPAPSGVY